MSKMDILELLKAESEEFASFVEEFGLELA